LVACGPAGARAVDGGRRAHHPPAAGDADHERRSRSRIPADVVRAGQPRRALSHPVAGAPCGDPGARAGAAAGAADVAAQAALGDLLAPLAAPDDEPRAHAARGEALTGRRRHARAATWHAAVVEIAGEPAG